MRKSRFRDEQLAAILREADRTTVAPDASPCERAGFRAQHVRRRSARAITSAAPECLQPDALVECDLSAA